MERESFRTVLKMFDGSEIPSPGLAATLSPSDGERDGVRGGSADLVADILFAVRSNKYAPSLHA